MSYFTLALLCGRKGKAKPDRMSDFRGPVQRGTARLQTKVATALLSVSVNLFTCCALN